MAPNKRSVSLRLFALLVLLAFEAVVLRFIRWQAIEDAKPFASIDLSFLVSHRDSVKAVLFITAATALLLFKEIANPAVRSRLAEYRASAASIAVNLLAFAALAALIWAAPTQVFNNWLSAYQWVLPATYALLAAGWTAVVNRPGF